MTEPTFPPTRAAALKRLSDFVPRAGPDYAATRNYDVPGHANVSALSPYLRHRLITEEEVLSAVLSHWPASSAAKFIDEVFWRTYWKGWLQQRPAVWDAYRQELGRALDRVQTEAGLRADWEAACRGDTGIEAFDHWARELVQTGYLHNHARMWAASIWIFTLNLPWVLGADFFLRHLLDGDAASNTLSWRWVAGLQTRGKHYVAHADNIAKFTKGRFAKANLAVDPAPLDGPPAPELSALPEPEHPSDEPFAMLLTDDDLSPDPLLNYGRPVATACVLGTADRSPLVVSDNVQQFAQGAAADVRERLADSLGQWSGQMATASEVANWAEMTGARQLVMHRPIVGPAHDRLQGLPEKLQEKGMRLVRVIRPYDQVAHPHATAGFFKLKKAIPKILKECELT